MKKNTTLAQVIQDYFDKIDDYFEAKEEFIKDVNTILAKKGDDDGIIDKCKIRDIQIALDSILDDQ